MRRIAFISACFLAAFNAPTQAVMLDDSEQAGFETVDDYLLAEV